MRFRCKPALSNDYFPKAKKNSRLGLLGSEAMHPFTEGVMEWGSTNTKFLML